MAYFPNFSDPAYGFDPGAPQPVAQPVPPPVPQPQPGLLSGSMPSMGWNDFVQGGGAAALGGALLAAHGNLSNGLAAYGQVAPQVTANAQRRAALNNWLIAKSKGGSIDPATMQLLRSDPQLAEGLAGNMLTPHREWKQIGTGPYGNAIFGWADAASGQVTPASAVTSGGAGGATGGDAVQPVSFAANGQPDPQQQAQFLQGLDPGVASLVKGIADYKLDPSKATSLKGGSREQILGLVSRYDPSYDATQFGVRNKMRLNMEAGGMYGQAIDSLNQSIKHLGSMAENYKGLNNTSVPLWNSIANSYAYNTGNTDFQKSAGAFTQDADAIAGEVAKVFKGQGSTAEAEIKNWRAGLSADMPPAAFKSSINELISHLLKARLDNIRSDYESAMHKPMEFDPIRPETKQVLQKLGIDPGQLDDAGTPAALAGGGGAAPAGVTHVWSPQTGLQPVK
jgi:hypothetical protein